MWCIWQAGFTHFASILPAGSTIFSTTGLTESKPGESTALRCPKHRKVIFERQHLSQVFIRCFSSLLRFIKAGKSRVTPPFSTGASFITDQKCDTNSQCQLVKGFARRSNHAGLTKLTARTQTVVDDPNLTDAAICGFNAEANLCRVSQFGVRMHSRISGACRITMHHNLTHSFSSFLR